MVNFEDIMLLNGVKSTSRLWSEGLGLAKRLGFKTTIYACPPPHKKPTHPQTIVRYHGIADSEFQQFVLSGLIGQGHLTTKNSLFEARPFRWSEIGSQMTRADGFAELKEEANRSGIDEGWVFPLFGPQDRVGLASFGKPERPELMETHMGERLFVFAQMAHLKFCQLTPDLFVLEKDLSKRETQIISWVAKGKSNSEIGAILKLSESSVDNYLRRAFSKLGVHDRTSAAVKAISMDIVRI